MTIPVSSAAVIPTEESSRSAVSWGAIFAIFAPEMIEYWRSGAIASEMPSVRRTIDHP